MGRIFGKVKNPILIISLMGFSLFGNCQGCGDDIRFIRTIHETGLYESPESKSPILTVPSGQLIRLLEKKPALQNAEGKSWYHVEYRERQGYVLLDPSQYGLSNTTESTEETTHTDEDTPDDGQEMSFQPKRVRPLEFDPSGDSFSLGLGCTGNTHSEFSVVLKFDDGKIQMIDSGLLEYGLPGESCSSGYEEVFSGTYEIDGKTITARFDRRESRTTTANFPNCDRLETKTDTEKITRKDVFYMLECDGHRALQIDAKVAASNAPIQPSDDEQGEVVPMYSPDEYFVIK